ncbi:ABC transporter ATP-binding protein [Kerstersia gyiorum]|uniref:Lipopolysaccharide export system ATP-binding protein LptB n=1 Tax=Kerstersia gyiorum TaxID=206506 RepID=A0A4Q7MT66_9BURK|nr:ABC transporter ATP-binding protein [Kerstersia gyiorum]KAB0543717.1 ABC transporter ATP-binding protein [Kerstersia gyiorum]MCP1634667.1 branched-chain amino acid transport system ATP-binding protein [Kerstersia gyiorum]MCP1636975.1 branched-chain amino acid transport system ATP-binding protein [Kerstersia gyiorum]MCP1670452.1 branched-chain amino acid transport system ATP-binding protein [Kerstersia gyiorum]MCP1678895.1 branched-chain amino acid transport system ATP-binding protein [Kerst
MLVVENVTVTYGPFKAVDQASLRVDAGETIGLAGTNGAGKTTLFAAIAGQLPATTGSILFQGRQILGQPTYRRAGQGLCRTFQVPREFGRLTVLENLLVAAQDERQENMLTAWLGRRGMRETVASRTRQADGILDMLGISHVRDLLASQLSGGQKKLLELARVLMQKPSIILLDEPFAGVNPVRIGEMMEIFTRLKAQGIALLIVEHHLQALRSLSSRLYVMDQGKVIAEGDPATVLNSKIVQDAYMGGVI